MAMLGRPTRLTGFYGQINRAWGAIERMKRAILRTLTHIPPPCQRRAVEPASIEQRFYLSARGQS